MKISRPLARLLLKTPEARPASSFGWRLANLGRQLVHGMGSESNRIVSGGLLGSVAGATVGASNRGRYPKNQKTGMARAKRTLETAGVGAALGIGVANSTLKRPYWVGFHG